MASLLRNNPELAKEWHPTENIPLTPNHVTPGSNKRVWWVCSKGHEWEAMINMRNRGRGCPYCAGNKVSVETSLYTVNPRLASEWHPTKNGSLTPKDVSPGSTKKAWWFCKKGHEWEAQIRYRNRGTGCPYCAGRIGSDNCLEAINPKLAKQWHPKKNGGLTPKDVTPNSDKKAWWICDRGHEWQATISNRNRARGCPYCAGRAVGEDNCLETVNPSLAGEWHPVKNGRLTTRDVTPGSNKRVWWRCRKGHAWEAIINSRNQGFGRCPYCRSR
jgi:hypothetical protein